MEYLLDCSGYAHSGLEIVRAAGSELFTRTGQRIFDFESGVWCAGLGHAHPHVTEVLRRQALQAMHLGYRVESPIADRAASMVLDTLSMAKGKCIFLASGSEAVEFGVQAARRLTGRTRTSFL